MAIKQNQQQLSALSCRLVSNTFQVLDGRWKGGKTEVEGLSSRVQLLIEDRALDTFHIVGAGRPSKW